MPVTQALTLPTDELTGIPNREGLFGYVSACIRKNKKFSMIYIDIDNFKYVNNLFGHNIGDQTLKEISILLLGSIRKYNGMLARLCGDEFIAVLEGPEYQRDIESIAQGVLKIFNNDWKYNCMSIQLTASIGTVLFPQHGYSCDELLKNANMALCHAKKQGHNTFQLFNSEIKANLHRKIILQDSLRQAVRNEELELHYQPVYNTGNRDLRGFEALARWNNREFGYVSPLEFIPLAEENGSIVTIGSWIMETAVRKCSEINRHTGRPFIMSINISAAQLKHRDFTGKLEEIIRKHEIGSGIIELEITESMFIGDFENVAGILGKVRDLGVRIALDDFGTGYSSLVYLKRLQLDTLKIDKAFISDLEKSVDHKNLFSSIMDIAHNLRLEVVSEGIETEGQLDIVREFHCEFGQGYLLDRPMDERQLSRFLDGFNL